MDYFKPGTLGYELYDDPSKRREITKMLQEPDLGFGCRNNPPTSQVRRYERAINQIEEPEEPNPDDLLRQQDFYDSTDTRSCINRKKT